MEGVSLCVEMSAALQAANRTESAVPLDNRSDSIDLFYLLHNLQAHRKVCFASCRAIIVEVWLNDSFLLSVITNRVIKNNFKDTCLETELILAFTSISQTYVLCQLNVGTFPSKGNTLDRWPIHHRTITHTFTPICIVSVSNLCNLKGDNNSFIICCWHWIKLGIPYNLEFKKNIYILDFNLDRLHDMASPLQKQE